MTLDGYLEREYSPTATRGYKNMIDRYLLAMGEKAGQATYQDVLDYIGLLREQQLHPKTLRNNLLAIKIYYRYLVATGEREGHPCQYLYLEDQLDRQIQIENLYPKATLQELYETYQAKNPKNQQRDKIIISLLVYQALTVLEISQLKTSDIDLEAGTITIKGNKKNKGRGLSLKPNQVLLFHNYLNNDRGHCQEKQDWFILSPKGQQLNPNLINRIINRGREQKLIPLKIRQSVIAHLLKEKNDVRIVQEFAGHRRASSTEAYQQSGLDDLKTSIEKLHPLQ